MKLAVFGAAGRTGRLLVDMALDGGHEVAASVRNREKLAVEHERLSVVEGDARDPERVQEAESVARMRS